MIDESSFNQAGLLHISRSNCQPKRAQPKQLKNEQRSGASQKFFPEDALTSDSLKLITALRDDRRKIETCKFGKLSIVR